MDIFRRIKIAITLLLAIAAAGVVGYRLIEGWPLLEAFYMTIITISTVGFREVHPLSDAGHIFTILLIMGGVGTLGYTVGALVEFMVEGALTGFMRRRRMEKKLEEMKDHYIVCGYGRVGQQVVRELAAADAPFVVIENDPAMAERCANDGFLCLEGDASHDEVLEKAGVRRARGLVAAVDTDADNVFVTLSARVINNNLTVVARATTEEARQKLERAGADKVVMPTVIGGRRMASMLLKPLVTDYLDVVMHGEEVDYQLEAVEVTSSSAIVGQTLETAGLRERTGAVVLAIKDKSGRFVTALQPQTRMESGDILLVLGTRTQLEAMQELL